MATNVLHANDLQGTYPPSWYVASAAIPDPQPPLRQHGETEICIIGAGFTGLSAALHLAQAGRRVVVLDAHRIGWGASGRNGGQVGSGQRRNQIDLEAMFGHKVAHRLWLFADEAKNLVRGLIDQNAIECDVTPGIIHADHRARFTKESRNYVARMDGEYGYDALRFLDSDAIRQLIGSKVYYSGTHDSGAFHLHPMKYVLGLARAAIEAGAVIHENTEVLQVEAGDPAILHLATGPRLKADKVIYACNGYLGGISRRIASRVIPINNFMVATEPLGEEMARSLIADNAAVADSRFVVNYFRLTNDHRLLFGGGESYGQLFPADIAGFVRKRMVKVFPQLRDTGIDHAWGGTLAITRNRMPLFAKVKPNIWSASGYSGHGISIATLAGKIISDAVQGNPEDFLAMVNIAPPRFPGGAALRSPLLTLAMLWFSLRDRM